MQAKNELIFHHLKLNCDCIADEDIESGEKKI